MIFRRFPYNSWANRQTLLSLRAHGDAAPERAGAVFAHIVAAERLWLGRLGFADPAIGPLPVWPTLTLDESGRHLDALADAWPGNLDRLVADGLGRAVSYTNSLGERYASTAGDILEHLLSHGAYHRGQVATLLGRAGLAPALTDFIHWARTVEAGAG